MPLLQRAPTKLKEVRDFHVEKAINSSMPKRRERGRQAGRQAGREGEGMSGDISNRGRYGGGGDESRKCCLIQSSRAMRKKQEWKYEKLGTFDVVLPNVQNGKKKSQGAYSQKYILQGKEKVVKDKQIDERHGK